MALEFGQPGHQLEGALHMGRSNGAGVLAGGLFQRSLGQMIEQSRQTLGGLQQVQGGFLEEGRMNAGWLQAGWEIASDFPISIREMRILIGMR